MKKGFTAYVLVAFFALFGLLLFSGAINLATYPILLAPPQTLLPASCSDADIQTAWENILDERFDSNVVIIKDNTITGECHTYLAYKRASDKLFLIESDFDSSVAQRVYTVAIAATLSSDGESSFDSQIGNYQLGDDFFSDYLSELDTSDLRTRSTIDDPQQAQNEFEREIILPLSGFSNLDIPSLGESYTAEDEELSGYILSEYRLIFMTYTEEVTIPTFCGDGTTQNPNDDGVSEQCDDGNTANGDGCSSSCQNELPIECGNGVEQTGEECDDGNTNDTDDCKNDCTLWTFCGDGTTQNPNDNGLAEQCDDGNTNPSDACSNDCTTNTLPQCGNGIIETGEQCDPEDNTADDWCTNSCEWETVPTPAAYYNFDIDLTDQEGNNNLIPRNGPSLTSGKPGLGQAIELDGIDDYLEFPSVSRWKELENRDLTVSFWIKPLTIDPEENFGIIGTYTTFASSGQHAYPVPDQSWNVFISPDKRVGGMIRTNGGEWDVNEEDQSGATVTSDPNTLSENEWTHITYVKDRASDTLELYINGENVGRIGLFVDGSTANDEELRIGIHRNNYLHAVIDEVKIWEVALNDNEILNVSNNAPDDNPQQGQPEIDNDSPEIDDNCNWQAQESACMQGDERIISYTSDTCTEGAPADVTEGCDYDGNNLIGDEDDIFDDNVNIRLYIDGERAEDAEDIEGEERIEIRDEEGNAIVEFDYDFDDKGPLDLKKIKIVTQTENTAYGYTIVDGLDDIEKTIRVPIREDENNGICFQNSAEDNSDITRDCDRSGEVDVECPGSYNDVECSIEGDFYQVSGLDSTGVWEISYPDGGDCTPDWDDCTSWSACVNGERTRTCTDLNGCDDGTLEEEEFCSVQQNNNNNNNNQNTCTPNWDCEPYPDECPDSGIKRRTCTDLNSCGQSTKEETRSCVQPNTDSSGLILWLAIGFLILGIVAIVVILIVKHKKSSKKGTSSTYQRPIVHGGGMNAYRR